MGKHRAQKLSRQKKAASRPAIGVAALAVAGAAVLGVTPTLATSPDLMAALHYLRGTNIGTVPTDQEFVDFIDEVLVGAGASGPEQPYHKVPYNAGFRPFSRGGFRDLTFDKSVAQGVDLLTGQHPAAGDVIFGFSQGAVAASIYKGDNSGNTYVLVANPGRANGGLLQRFKGLKVPLIDVSFGGATPVNGDFTIDVTRQYDGWSDFPAYLWNPVAVANALLGIAWVHGQTQWELTAQDLEDARAAGSDYYQFDAASNTAYYVIRTYPVPLLMPLQSFLPASAIAALDAPLRAFIETAYDRSDYSKPTRSWMFKPLRPRAPAPPPEAATVETPAPQPQSTPTPVADDSEAPADDEDLWSTRRQLADDTSEPAADNVRAAKVTSKATEPQRRNAEGERPQRRSTAEQSRSDRSDAA
ncbi:PE-PPE domain-containing protein [Mycobacterium sp. SMC-4]|uniref:PE-PPE domain-containing protein n=1 Tax=Mycobacterium sp. SMC-4 TaxID=2857059 RepID=UPI0021B1C659|nr:PE-PPE domain-containing protein [Mycobacterium sp. SMC-4]UXA18750.1 PE-PPE domain-containing protein [Mycobacterium sp. SMC-4]